MRAGDTILLPDRAGDWSGECHLWVVISDPDQDAGRIVLVMLATWEAGLGDSCIFEAGEIPFARHNTYAAYAKTAVVSLQAIDKLIATGRAKAKEPCPPAALQKLRDGAGETRRMQSGHQKILEDQGLI